MLRWTPVIVLLAGMAGADVFGQSLPFSHYTPESEITPLPSSAVQKVYHDRLGFAWFAVYSTGLVRYDGHEMLLFDTNDGLRDLNLWEIVEDRDGRLWIGSDAGVVCSDKPLSAYAPGERPRFTARIGSLLLPDVAVRQNRLVADVGGFVWAGTDDFGVLRWAGGQGATTTVDTLAVGPDEVVRALTTDSEGTVWVGISTGSAGRLMNANSSSTALMQAVEMKEIPNVLSSLGDGFILAGTRQGTVWEFREAQSGSSGRLVVSGVPALIVGLLPWSESELWIATEGAGLLRANLDGSGYYHPGGQESEYVHQVTSDREGNLWLARTGGVSKLPYKFDAFQNFTAKTDADEDGILPADAVTSVIPPSERGDCTWVGSIGGGLACLGDPGEVDLISTEQGLPSSRVNALAPGRDGVVWIGSHQGIAALVSANGPDLPSVFRSDRLVVQGRPYRLLTLGTRGTSVEAIAKVDMAANRNADSKVETIWFPSYLQLVAYAAGQWIELGEQHGLPVTLFRDVVSDDEGRLWIGTFDSGIFRSVGSVTVADLTKAGIRFDQVWSEASGAPANEIESLLFHDGVVWAGTPAGLIGLDPNTIETIVHIGTDEGLPASNATSISLSPVTGSIWVGTNGGLAEVDPGERRLLRTVTKADGLVDNEVCYYGSVRVAMDGSIYYGTCKGLAIYRPHLDRQNEVPPAPQITRFEYHENAWGDNELIVAYAGLSFANERQVRYRTRLVGYDEDWSETTLEHRIRYTNLPAYITSRNYRFEVQASNDSGVWSDAPTLVRVDVMPAWWIRWWAVLLWIAIAFGGMVVYVRHKTRIHEEQLAKEREINEQLRRVDKLKDEFLANTSHELRTPLNGIIGIAESLLDGVAGSLNEVMRRNLVTVAMSGRRLAGLVNDILDFSKLAERNIELQLKPISVGVLTDVVLRISEPLLSGKELALVNDVPRDLPAANADEGRLQQILLNLVGNAVKFTHRGEVRVSAVDAGETLEVSVSDTGIGIPEEKFDAVFEAFEQVDASTAREYGGTGLGLSITKKLVETHGGTIWFESQVGVGTTFTFTLPKAEGEAQMPEALQSLSHLRAESEGETSEAQSLPVDATTNGEARARVLVVDDEPVNLQVLANHLSFANYEVAQALNGREALEMIDGGEEFDVVLLDIMMPRMSGYEVCERIREKYLPSELPVIMVTAKNQVADLVQGLDSGANDYLAKPFSKDELLARLKTHLNLLNISHSYSRFVPREFLHYLDRESILEVKLGDSVEKDMTIFVSDIRSFTTLSEGMTPTENFQFVNDYMAVAGPVIRDHHGFIDRYTGDAIMGLFADRADDALEAAVDTLRKIRDMNDGRVKGGKPPVQIGIGIHSGSLRLGIVGEEERAQGDIFSDAVNLANRIEGLTKLYGVSVVVSGETLGQLQDKEKYRTRFLGHVQVKGKNKAVSLYDLFDAEIEEIVERRVKTLPDYEHGIEAFLAARFEEAARCFERCLAIDSDDKTSRMYLERSLRLHEDGVPDDWDGVEAINFK